MVTLHHLEYSQSFRVLWLLEELGVDYALKLYNRDPATHLAPPEYKALSPTGAAPVITDGDLVLAESNAILEYLLDLYPNAALLPPAGSPDRARHLFWFHASQGSMMAFMLMDSIFRIIQQRVPFFLKPLLKGVLGKASEAVIRPRMAALLDVAEEHLAAQPWFGGDALSIADISLSYPMESASARAYITDRHPRSREWLQRVHERPAFKAAQEKDGHESMVLPLQA